MISLKREPKEEGGEGGETGCSPCWDQDVYPVRMHISNDEFDKLKLAGKKIGDEYELTLKVRITSMSSDQYQEDGETETRSSATLTALEADVPDDRAPVSERLFGSK